MSIEEDILAWVKDRPVWQKNLIKRICRGESVDEEYVDKLAKQIVEDSTALELPELTTSDLPSGMQSGNRVHLVSIGNLRNVNALLSDQTLTFGPQGVTVVYGDNGCGKSGYARLAKEIVGARHKEVVLPDAYAMSSEDQEASISFAIDGTESDATWPSLDEASLRQVHFYDEACGDDYLINDTELAYRPSVLGVFDRLISLIDQVRAELDKLVDESNSQKAALPELHPGTEGSNLLKSISATTSTEKIEEFLAVTAEQEQELARLVKEEARLKTTDPTKEKARLSAGARGIAALASHLRQVAGLVGPSAGQDLLKLQESAAALRATSNEISLTSFSDEPLSGVGSATWRAMWEAAERYSTQEAYTGRDYPVTEKSDRCVLCQQTLDGDGQGRLQRFHRFVHNDVARQAKSAETTFQTKIHNLQEYEVATPEIMATIGFIRGENELLAKLIEDVLARAQSAKDLIGSRLRKQADDDWIELVDLDIDELDKLGAAVTERAAKIDEAEFRKTLLSTTRDLIELDDRVVLSKHRQAILSEVARLKSLASLQKVRSGLTTSAVTKESAELARKYVTEAVKDHFVRESVHLKLEKVILGDKGGAKGQLRHKPALMGASKVTPRQVLSEGEQTAAGLAGVFTEIAFDSTKSAVIFDDPVSSLDHERRDKVARRIVEIGTDRQVIVFTHDLMFLGEIVKATEELSVGLTERSIERNGLRQPGLIVHGYPWKAKDAKARMGELRTALGRIKKAQSGMSAEQYEKETCDWAGRLSETWERIVRSEVVNKVVDRGTTEVRPRMFRMLAQITEADNIDFQSGYGMTSKWARRHDKSEEVSYTPPTVDEMDAELSRLEAWQKRMVGYAK